MTSTVGLRVTRLGEVPLRFAESSGLESALAERGHTLRRRAATTLCGLLPGFDVQGSVDRPAQSAMFHGHSASLSAQVDALSHEIDHLIAHHDLRSQFEAMREGRLASASGIFEPRSIDTAGSQLRVGAAASAVASAGLTLRFTAVDQQLPSLKSLCWAFDAAYGVRSTANVYVTAGLVPGTIAHFDHHDVFLLQIVGSKGWQIVAPSHRPAPGRASEAVMDRADWEGTLVPGDVLYLPRGHVHRAVPLAEVSIHVTIAVRRPAYADVFGDLWAYVGSTGGWAEDLPAPADSGASIARSVDALLRTTNHDGAEFERMTAHVLAGYRANLPPRPRAPFRRVVAATQNPLEWSYRWALPTEPAVVDRPGGGFALAGWVLQPGPCCREGFVDMVGAERWTPDRGGDATLAPLIVALLELDVLDPLPSGGRQ